MAQGWRSRRMKRQLTEQEHQRAELRTQQLSEDAVVRTDKLEQRVQRLRFLLHASLSRELAPIDFEQLKQPEPAVDLGADAERLPVPHWDEYAPMTYGLVGRLLRRGSRATTEAEAEAAYAKALERYRHDEAARQQRVDDLERLHQNANATDLRRVRDHNASIEEFQRRVLAAEREAVTKYFGRVFSSVVDRSSSFPRGRRLAYVPESKLLLVEWQVPGTDVIPREKEYRYQKLTDSVGVHKWRSVGEVRDIYQQLLAQMALRAANTAFGTDPAELVDTVIFNAVAASDDDSGPCLFTMSTSRKHFSRLNLDDLDDAMDLARRHCGAAVSAYPDELAAVIPVVPYDLADPTVRSSSASRAPNLMTAPLEDFQRLVQRLLERVGYTVTPLGHATGSYLASSDTAGGEERSVVHVQRADGRIEAALVRGLQSAVRQQRAGGGMLFTTAGIEPQAFEYAHGRPLRLYDGHSVVAWCRKHNLPARIEPDNASGPGAAGTQAGPPNGLPEQRHDHARSGIDR
jgi:restriction system protein